MPPRDYPAGSGSSPPPAPAPGLGGGYHPPTDSTTVSGSTDIYGLGDLAQQEIILRDAYIHSAAVGRGKSAAWQRSFAQANDQPEYGQNRAVPGTVQDSYIAFIRMSQDPSKAQEYFGWQQKLFAAGFYGSAKPSDVAWHTWDLATGAALKAAFSAAVQVSASGAPITFDEYLTGLAGAKQASAAGAPTGPLVIQHEDPTAVAGMLQQAAQASLGRDLSDAEIEHFLSEFASAETAYYKQGNEAQNATGGQFSMTKPDLAGRAEAYVQGEHGTEAAGNNMADYVKALESMLGGG